MRLDFSDEQKEQGLHKAEIDDVLFTADYMDGEGKSWIMTGSAVVEGEVYGSFVVEIETAEEPAETDAGLIMAAEWAWYDFLFDA